MSGWWWDGLVSRGGKGRCSLCSNIPASQFSVAVNYQLSRRPSSAYNPCFVRESNPSAANSRIPFECYLLHHVWLSLVHLQSLEFILSTPFSCRHRQQQSQHQRYRSSYHRCSPPSSTSRTTLPRAQPSTEKAHRRHRLSKCCQPRSCPPVCSPRQLASCTTPKSSSP